VGADADADGDADMWQHQLGVLARLNALMVGAICKCN